MFWNDPILYGASFPYRDIPTPVQTPLAGPAFTPWQNVPRFVPPFYGFQTPFVNLMNPYMHTPVMNPFVHAFNYPIPQLNVPQFNVPQFNVPQLNVPQLGLPQLNWNRPFTWC